MGKIQHTPGPWTINTVNPHLIQIRAKKGNTEFECSPAVLGGWDTTALENEANASVIAAAPDLLEALKQAVFAMDSVFHLTGNKEIYPYIEQARKAIAKANGEGWVNGI